MTGLESTRSERKISIEAVRTAGAPEPVGPYSQAIVVDDMIFCSGQLGMDPASGTLVPGGVVSQARQALLNLGNVLTASGSGFDRVLKVTVFVRDIKDFVAVNQIYSEFFGSSKPARSVVEVSGLPKDALIEIDLIAKR